jgi:hypothetical protein
MRIERAQAVGGFDPQARLVPHVDGAEYRNRWERLSCEQRVRDPGCIASTRIDIPSSTRCGPIMIAPPGWTSTSTLRVSPMSGNCVRNSPVQRSTVAESPVASCKPTNERGLHVASNGPGATV